MFMGVALLDRLFSIRSSCYIHVLIYLVSIATAVVPIQRIKYLESFAGLATQVAAEHAGTRKFQPHSKYKMTRDFSALLSTAFVV